MAREIADWYKLTRDDFLILARPGENASEHNVYISGHGYLVDHIPLEARRDLPSHWDDQFQNIEVFQASWHPRPGPLEFVYNLTQLRKKDGLSEPMRILNLGGGYGDFTVNLAQIPGTIVTHVDFSQRANDITWSLVQNFNVVDRVEVVKADNREYLRRLIDEKQTVDFIFIYGGLAENTPLEKDIEDTLLLSTQVLNPGGYLWYVVLEQPFLEGNGDRTATDVFGEYPCRPGLIRDTVNRIPGMYLVRDVSGPRPDNHPLVAGGGPEDHMHIVYRGLFAKQIDGRPIETPNFDFKDALRPDWPQVWKSLQNQPMG